MEGEEFERVFRERYGVGPKLEGLLLMIGYDVLGRWPQGEEKLIKQELIALGAWRLLEWKGYALRQGVDAEGWPQFQLKDPLPYQTPEKEIEFLERAARAYFVEIWRNLEDARSGNH